MTSLYSRLTEEQKGKIIWPRPQNQVWDTSRSIYIIQELMCTPDEITKTLAKKSWLLSATEIVDLLNEYPEEIKNLNADSWYELSGNPAAIHILEENLDKVHWGRLSGNPSLVKVDYEYLLK